MRERLPGLLAASRLLPGVDKGDSEWATKLLRMRLGALTLAVLL